MRNLTFVVVGGGIAGLAGAYEARRSAERRGLPMRIVLLESGDRFGGKVLTEVVDGRQLEWGPDGFVAAKPEARQLATELGFAGDLMPPSEARKTYLYLRGRMRELPPGLAMGVPTGFAPLVRALRGGIVGPVGALRAAIEPLLPASKRDGDPSVGEVARRRLGRQVTDRLVEPLLGGVYGAPADQISLRVALPHLAQARSLLFAVASGPRPGAGSGPSPGPIFLTPRRGMGQLVDGVLGALGGEDLRLETAARSLQRDGDRYRVVTDAEELVADAVLVAAPAPAAAGLLDAVAPDAAAPLRAMRYRASVIVQLRYPPDAVVSQPDAWGFLRATEEDALWSACTFVGTKWPHLADDSLRLRAVVSSPAAADLSDDELRDRVSYEIGRAAALRKPADDVRLKRWPQSMPVYEPGHLDRVAAARAGVPRGVALAGAAYEGVGVPDCIRTGRRAAETLVDALADASDRAPAQGARE